MISVIVPIYNVSQYLNKCIESICRQTYKDLEIILVDDGSDDGSEKICDSYLQKDARIVVIHKENGGLVSARKAGLAASHGRYIAYVDGDDWIEHTMYEKLLKCLLESDSDVSMCGRYEDTGAYAKPVYHGAEQGTYKKEQMIESIYPRMIVNEVFFKWGIFPGVWDKLFKRECLEKFQMKVDERIRMGEDAVCTYPCLLNVESIYVLHECLYHYRQTTNSMVKQIDDYEREREQFRILYRTGMEQFERYQNIFDCRQQWEKYVLFLMIPRSDGLYHGYSELSWLFPFPKVKKNMHIILYGAGTYGQRLYQYLKKSQFCNVVLWVDRNYAEFRKMGLDVVSPEEIQIDVVDQIVLAITYAEPKKLLYQELVSKFGKQKISLVDQELLFTTETKQAFGIGE